MPGNHDARDALRASFPEHSYLRQWDPFVQYAIDDFPVRIVALDSLVPREGGGTLCADRLAWLDRTLSVRDAVPTVVALHHPPFTTGIGHMDKVALDSASVAGLAAVIALAGYALAAFESDVMTVGLHWQTAVFAAVTGCVAVASCVWVIAWFERRWNGEPSAMTSAAARGSYAAYVLHPPLLVLLSWLLVAVPVPVEMKFVLVAAAGIPLCFAVGYGVTRLPGVSRVL
jgi:peptidoglycan/LPS O-acetylase OafA/YrhL